MQSLSGVRCEQKTKMKKPWSGEFAISVPGAVEEGGVLIRRDGWMRAHKAYRLWESAGPQRSSQEPGWEGVFVQCGWRLKGIRWPTWAAMVESYSGPIGE